MIWKRKCCQVICFTPVEVCCVWFELRELVFCLLSFVDDLKVTSIGWLLKFIFGDWCVFNEWRRIPLDRGDTDSRRIEYVSTRNRTKIWKHVQSRLDIQWTEDQRLFTWIKIKLIGVKDLSFWWVVFVDNNLQPKFNYFISLPWVLSFRFEMHWKLNLIFQSSFLSLFVVTLPSAE